MKNSTGLSSVPSDPLVPFTDQLRLAVAAYLARFQGASRYHTESGLRCYMTWSADMTWTRWPRAACTWSCTSGGCRRSGGVSWREWLVQGSVARVQGFLDSGQECCAAEP